MIKDIIARLEDTPMSTVGWLAAFVGVIWIRCILEAFSSPDLNGFLPSNSSTLIHFTLFFLAATTLIIVAVSSFVRVSALRMMRATIFILPIIWLAPLIDLMHGVYAKISYVPSATLSDLLYNFLTYFGPLTGFGATLGLRIELGTLIVLIGVYIYINTQRIRSALLSAFVAYSVIFITSVVPSLFTLLSSRGGLLGTLQDSLVFRSFLPPAEIYAASATADLLSDVILAQTFFLVLCGSALVWFYRVQKNAVCAVVKNIRPSRVTHFLIAAFLGGLIALAEGAKISWSIFDWITLVTAMLTIFFAWLFAVAINDLADESIDAISNTNRPLITGALTREAMREIALIFGILALLGSLSLGSYSFYLLSIFSAAYYIYSAPPIRLKRVPLLAPALIGIATLVIMMLGFFLISPSRELAVFPAPIALLVVLCITLILNARDLKDREGDAVAGIWTLPTLLGDRWARMVIGAMTFIAAVLVPIFITIPILWAPSLVAGIVSWIGLVRGAGERFSFILVSLYLVSVVLILSFI